jgi:glyoxylase-like metal-dependent hydrolase (beta-lactamase superfamily II)
VYLSHYHWDHCGDVTEVEKHVPVLVGHGTLAAIHDGTFGLPMGTNSAEAIGRLAELPAGDLEAAGLNGGIDVFGDSSFVLFAAPGVGSHPERQGQR